MTVDIAELGTFVIKSAAWALVISSTVLNSPLAAIVSQFSCCFELFILIIFNCENFVRFVLTRD